MSLDYRPMTECHYTKLIGLMWWGSGQSDLSSNKLPYLHMIQGKATLFFTERQVFCLGTFVDYGFPFLTYHIRSPLIPLSLDLSLQYSVNYGPNG